VYNRHRHRRWSGDGTWLWVLDESRIDAGDGRRLLCANWLL
jgi:hypothetical protein